MFIEFLKQVLAIPVIRGIIEDVIFRIIAEVFHRRSVDPEFLKHSDQAFAALAQAKTIQEKAYAQNLLRSVMSSGK